MKPNIAFLRKVEAGEVYAYFSYTMRRGGSYGFRGGEATYEKHRAAGYVTRAGGCSLGRRGEVHLTDLGRQALEAASIPPSQLGAKGHP